MENYIQELIDQGEHQRLDFKFEISDSRKIAKSLVAFANTNGGKLLVGVKDNGAIVGVRSDEEFYMVEAAASLYSRPEIFFTSKEWRVNGKIVLEIDISKSDNLPHYAKDPNGKWLAYIRKQDENLLTNNIQLEVWKREKKGSSVYIEFREEERLLFDFLDRKKKITLVKFIKLAQIPKFKAEKIIINLVIPIKNPNNFKIKIIDHDIDIEINGHNFDLIDLEKRIVIPKRFDDLISVPISINNRGIISFKTIKAVYQIIAEKKIHIKAKGFINVRVLFITKKIIIDEKRTIKLKGNK